jgi:putative transposase
LLFKNPKNYQYFLKQAVKFIDPIREIYFYCLIPNHFHLTLKIKDQETLLDFVQEKLKKLDLEFVDKEDAIFKLIS